MKEKKHIPLDAIMTLIIMVFAGALAVDGFVRQKLPADAVKYPIFVFSVIAIVGIYQVFASLKAARGEDYKPVKVFENRKNFLVTFAMMIAYVIVMYLLGFILASIIFSVAIAVYLKFKRMISFTIATAAASVGIYYIFVKVLYIFLPTGLLFDKLF